MELAPKINKNKVRKSKENKRDKKDGLPLGVPENLRSTINKYGKKLLKYPNVLCIGVGIKRVNGKATIPPINAIIVNVTHKIKDINEKDKIPLVLDGIQTDVVSMGGGIIPA